MEQGALIPSPPRRDDAQPQMRSSASCWRQTDRSHANTLTNLLYNMVQCRRAALDLCMTQAGTHCHAAPPPAQYR